MECLVSIDKDCYKIAKRDNLFTCFSCELESIPSAAVEANSIPLQQSRPKRNRKPNPRYDQSSPKRRNAAVIPFSDSVIASTSSTTNIIVNETFTIHSSSNHSVVLEEVVPPMPSINMGFPDIPQELLDMAVANMSLNDSAINPFDFSFRLDTSLHPPSPVRPEDNSTASRSSFESENGDTVHSPRHVTPVPIREKSLIYEEPITPAIRGKDVRSQNKVYMRTNERIKDIWEKYQHTKEYTVDDLLKYCSKTYRMPCEYDQSD
ncbi:uncharacterized protein LOC123470688 [Daphnia magna]|uniref:uncharacterized protein LOC123470688 n=1 Tax=Daphnia magna TaxID=35525 RepID=UPI001E1BBC3D|nr:uncharacterized protein LOC123470688 [Daphnia magna]